MIILTIGLSTFFAVHTVSIVNEPWHDRMIERLGEGQWERLYSLVSLLGFVLLVWGSVQARQDSRLLYSFPEWFRHLTMLLMVPVFTRYSKRKGPDQNQVRLSAAGRNRIYQGLPV